MIFGVYKIIKKQNPHRESLTLDEVTPDHVVGLTLKGRGIKTFNEKNRRSHLQCTGRSLKNEVIKTIRFQKIDTWSLYIYI